FHAEVGEYSPSRTPSPTPPAISTSARRVPVASTTVPPRKRTSPAKIASRPQHEEEDGHAHGDAVGDLAGDDGAGEVGDFGSDLHAAVHRTRVHDERGVAGVASTVTRGAVE